MQPRPIAQTAGPWVRVFWSPYLQGAAIVVRASFVAAAALTRRLALGTLYANLEAGDIELPWASIAGFVDVAVVMAVLVWLAHRRRPPPAEPTEVPPRAGRWRRRRRCVRARSWHRRQVASHRLPVGPLRVQQKVYYIDS